MITHLLYILMIDETYRAQNEQQRPLQDLSTLPKLLSVKHSLPRRVPTSQADHYSKEGIKNVQYLYYSNNCEQVQTDVSVQQR